MEKRERDFLEAIQLIQKIFRKIRERELDLVANQSKCMCNANNINNSDIDMCEWKDKLYITYSWGNQFYKDNMAYAEFDGTEREFCESFWM